MNKYLFIAKGEAYAIRAESFYLALEGLKRKVRSLGSIIVKDSNVSFGYKDRNGNIFEDFGIEDIMFKNCTVSAIIEHLVNDKVVIIFVSCTINYALIQESKLYKVSFIENMIRRLKIELNEFDYLRIGNSVSGWRTSVDIVENKIEVLSLEKSSIKWSKITDNEVSNVINMMGTDIFGSTIRLIDESKVIINDETCGYVMACPEKGPFIGYKKCMDGRIVTLFIPEDAKRSSSTTNKCRCNKCVVLGVEDYSHDINNPIQIRSAESMYHDFTYTVGEIIEVKDFDEDRWNECSPGIHFFMNKSLAMGH